MQEVFFEFVIFAAPNSQWQLDVPQRDVPPGEPPKGAPLANAAPPAARESPRDVALLDDVSVAARESPCEELEDKFGVELVKRSRPLVRPRTS